MNINLPEYNQPVYAQLLQTMTCYNKCALCAATGTGKSYITAKYIQETDIEQDTLILGPSRPSLKIWHEYHDRYKDRDCNSLDSIHIPGDEIALTIKGKNNGEDVFIDFRNCRLAGVETSKIGNGYIYITGGYKQFKNTTENIGEKLIKIPVELMVYSSASVPDERLKFDEEQYVEDFFSIMSAEEKKEFATTPLDDIIKKWFDVIVDRSWLYREEHGFKHKKKTTKRIIKKIKKKCEKEIFE